MLFDCGGYWLEVLGGSTSRDLVVIHLVLPALKKRAWLSV